MAFLANDGDIICDMVCTDLGSKRLAEGNFKIAKFALGDEEINYELYDKSHPSGSAFYDLTLLQTPVLEASRKSDVSMKSKLVSMRDNGLLYLPTLKLNLGNNTGTGEGDTAKHSSGTFPIIANEATMTALGVAGTGIQASFATGKATNAHIRIDQGLDTLDITKDSAIPRDLIGNQYLVKCDHRLLRLTTVRSGDNAGQGSDVGMKPSFIDENQIASYFLTFIPGGRGSVANLSPNEFSPIAGPRGTKVSFKFLPSLEVQTSNFLFDQIGYASSAAFTNNPPGNNLTAGTYKQIDTVCTVIEMNTQSSIDVHLRLIRST